MQIGFKKGDIVDAFGEIAVIKDILKSENTGTMVLFVRFARNIGDSRPYDMLVVSPERDMGVSQWKPASRNELTAAVDRRLEYIRKEIAELLSEKSMNPPI